MSVYRNEDQTLFTRGVVGAGRGGTEATPFMEQMLFLTF